MKLHFDKISRYLRINEPVSTAVPFPQGLFTNPNHVRIVDDERILAPQVKTTAIWPDGSIKWLHICFEIDLFHEHPKQAHRRPVMNSTAIIGQR